MPASRAMMGSLKLTTSINSGARISMIRIVIMSFRRGSIFTNVPRQKRRQQRPKILFDLLNPLHSALSYVENPNHCASTKDLLAIY